MVSFLCCKAAPDEDAPSTPKKKKSAVAPRQPSPEEPEETVVETKEEPETGFDSLLSSMGGGDATSGRSPMHGEADKKKAAAAGPAEPRRGRGLLANFGGRGGSARSFLGLGGGAAPTQAEAAAAAGAHVLRSYLLQPSA